MFSGRRDFFELYGRLVDPGSPLEVVVAFTDGSAPGLGKKRLLRELAVQALRDGHVPVSVIPAGAKAQDAPKSPRALGVALLDAIVFTRQKLSLDPPVDSLLLRVLLGGPPEFSEDRDMRELQLQDALAEALDSERPIRPGTLRAALAADLGRLAAAARAAGRDADGGCPLATIHDGSRAIVFLHGVEGWDEGRALLFETLLGPEGLGTPDEPVPTVLTCTFGDIAADVLDVERDRLGGQPWIVFKRLAPLDERESMLASQLVLLHPRPGLNRFSHNVYAALDATHEAWRKKVEELVQGLPENLEEEALYATADTMVDFGVFVRGDDEGMFEGYMRAQR
jgi:hypothetical protein